MKRILSLFLTFLLALVLTGCHGGMSRSDVGLLTGGVAGGIVGHAVTGSTLGTIGGTVGGAYLGREIARH